MTRLRAPYVVLACGTLVLLAAAGVALYRYEAQYSIADIVAQCERAAPSYKALCYTNGIDAVLSHDGLKDALDLVAAAYIADNGFVSSCHSNMHELGAAAYKQFEASGHIDLTDSTSDCGYGFYHGFVNEMIYETGSFSQAAAFCGYVGRTLGGDEQYAEGACYHGIGHGVTDGTDPSLWGNAVKVAAPGLALCEEVATSTDYRFRCDSGVFNAVAIMYRDPEYKLNAHGDPFSLCTSGSYDATQKKACYEEMNSLASFLAHDTDVPKAMSFTASIADPYFRDIAIKSVAGMAQPMATSSFTSALAADACKQFTGAADHENCIRGMVDSTIEFGTPGVEYVKALQLCESNVFPLTDQRTCADEVMSYSEGIYPVAKQNTICKLIPAELVPQRCTYIAQAAASSSS